MARMETDSNLKKLSQLYQFYHSVFEKSPKTSYGLLSVPSRIHLMPSSWCFRSILCKSKKVARRNLTQFAKKQQKLGDIISVKVQCPSVLINFNSKLL